MKKKICSNEKIFIAGARGMAGSAICRSLVQNSYGESKKGGLILTPSRDELNLLSIDAVKKWFEINRPSIVILAAAKVGGIHANAKMPGDFILENLKIQTNIIESAWEFKVKRLLFLGSSCIYPKLAQQPIKEEYLLKGPLEATNEPYAIAKIAGIKLCQALRKQYNFDAISLMPTNLFGPGDNYDLNNSHVMAALLRKFIEAKKYSYSSVTCWGTGDALREFLYVDDLGDAVVHALERWDPRDKEAPIDNNGEKLDYLNVGTGKDISIKNLAKEIAALCDYKGKIEWDLSKPDGTPKKQLDISKIKEIGWEPKVNLQEGLRRTINSFQKTSKIKGI